MLIHRGIGKDQIIVPPKFCAVHEALKWSKSKHKDGDKNEDTVEGRVYLNHRGKAEILFLRCHTAIVLGICRFCGSSTPSHHHAFCMLNGQTNRKEYMIP